MVGRDTVTFKFRLDAKEMQRLIKALEADAARFGAKMQQVGNQSDAAGKKIKDTGTNAAAAAVNFQTATQGMLNLSTAAVQTFTSISNLDRAANRLAQSKIAVARAEDLLAAKQLRLNELQEKGLGHTTKAANLTNELATARADLAVKNDKARIEEGALLDIQLLFVTNVANVMISSIQTIKTMRDMQALSTIRATIAESGLITKMKALVLAQAAVSRNVIGTTTGFKGMTLAIKGMTFSVRGLMLALGPVALAITAVTVAMQAYEENWGGFKDAVQTALPFLKESNDDLDESARILEEDRKQMEGYVSAIDSMGNSMKKLSEPHKLYLQMHRDAFLAMDKNSKLAAYYSSQLAGLRTGPQGFSTPSVGGGLPSRSGISVGGGTVAGGGVTTAGGVSTGGVSSAPTTGGVGTPTTVTGNNQLGDLADPYGSGEQRLVFTMLPKDDKMSVLLSKAQGYMDQGNYGAANLYFAEHEKVKSQPVMENDPVKRWENMQKGVNAKETGFRLAQTRPQNLLKPHDKAGDGGIFDFELDNRQLVKTALGVDIGPIAHSINVNDAIRFGNIQKSLSQFNPRYSKYTTQMKSFTTGKAVKPGAGLMSLLEGSGIETGTAEFQVRSRNPLYGQATGGRESELMREIRNLGGINNLGQTSATALYQNVTVATPKRIRDANRNKDLFNNSLGAVMMNEFYSLKGSGRMVYSSAHRSLFKSRNFRVPGKDIFREAVRLGIKGNVEFMDAIKAIPDVDREAEDNMKQAYGVIRQAEAIANDYISMVNSAKASIGFTDAILRRATAEGHSGASMYANISLLSAAKRTNFSNTEIIEESKAKLALTNSQIFAIRFNATRGDTELQDRLRYVDQLEAMSSGTSPL